ncbi:MAG: glutamate--tRNA ligase [Candidatus Norongarragalinales archaeon]
MKRDLSEIARKHALKNAADYGKAVAGSVAAKVFAEAPEAKNDVETTMKLVAEEVARANKMTKAEIEEELKNYSFAEKKESKEEKRFKLEGAVEGKVVTRFLPEPNGPAHIGHAKAAWLSVEAARQWRGKCLLRWDDTNPEKEKQEFVDLIREDLKWLGLQFARESFASDFMPKFYECADKLVANGDAYVCKCTKATIGVNREAKKACDCRKRSAKENKALWEKMKKGGVAEGEAILRLRGDLNAENTVMRDPSLFRVIEAPHFRQGTKYKAWPTYDFEVSIADSLDGVTHALRSKEYELRDELYYYILDKVGGLRKPCIYDFSRLEIKGTALSKRVLRPLIESGKVWGWDDPRLPTLAGLRRRGILPNVIRDFVLSFGLSKVESQPTWTALLVANKRELDKTAPHFFFVADPVKLKVANAPRRKIKIRKHPKLELGERIIDSKNEFYLAGEDAAALKKSELFRLKDSYNVRLTKKTETEIEGEYAGEELFAESKKIQWVAANEAIDAELVVVSDLLNDKGEFNENSLIIKKGKCEAACAELKKGAAVQFERVGYAVLDDEKKKRFILSC